MTLANYRIGLPFKLAIIVFIVASVGVLIVSYFAFSHSHRLLEKHSLTTLSSNLERENSLLLSAMNNLKNDARFLQDLQEIHNLADRHASDTANRQAPAALKHNIARIFQTVMDNRPAYTQLRLIGMAHNGKELIRIDRVNGQLARVAEQRLQAKGHRYYFQQSVQLLTNQIYLSKIDLNREHGKISYPLTPTIRIGTPIYDQTGKLFGAIIINADFRLLNQDLVQQNDAYHHYFIANEQGDYLLHPDPNKQMAYEFDRIGGLQQDFPRLSDNMPQSGFSSFTLPDKKVALALHRQYFDELNPERYFLLGSVTDQQRIYADSSALAQQLAGSIMLVILLLSLLAAYASYLMTRRIIQLREITDHIDSSDHPIEIPTHGHDEISDLAYSFKSMLERLQQSRQQLQQLNTSLEQRVQQRTVELEDARQQAEKLAKKAEQAVRVKSAFLANMSHEIRTPMNAINGLLDLCLRKTPLTPKQRDYLLKANIATHSLLAIINDILDFSKIEAGKLKLESIPFELNNLLESLEILATGKQQTEGVSLLFERDMDIPEQLYGDPLRLGQILINLVSNAIKFTEHGEIIVSVSALHSDQQRIILEFCVQDSGIGISPQQQQHLFQPFSQADSSTTRQFGGTGLGLSICQRLVTLMEGDIAVSSELGQGTRFSFTVQLGLPKTPPTPAFRADILSNKQILVVDHSIAARRILQSYLSTFGCQVTLVDSLKSAIGALTANPQFDLVLAEWQLPNSNGLQLAAYIHQHDHPYPRPRFMLLSAYEQTHFEDHSQARYVDYFIRKPFTPGTLFNLSRQALGEISPPAPPPEPNPPPLEGLRGARILLVEDNHINQQIAYELLAEAQLVVDVAANGQQALEKLQQASYDGILMDIQMPIMDGFQTTAAIRANPSLQTLPIIAMTANALAGDREKVLAAGMNDYLSKPINPNILLNKLQTWIQPPHEASTQVQTSLPQLPGFNVPTGLYHVGGNPIFYKQQLCQFANGYQHTVNEIRAALTNNDLESAHLKLHTLKGLAATLGMPILSNLAASADHQSQTQSTISPGLLQELEAQLQADIQIIHQAFPKPRLTDHTKDSLNALRPELMELCNKLKSYDAEANDLLEQISQQLDENSLQQLNTLREFCLQFEYERAQQEIKRILEQH